MMGEVASARRRRTGLIRWALVTVPAFLLLGLLSARLGDSGHAIFWFDRLSKPALMPPGWVFPAAWSILYVLSGIALALILDARRVNGRGVAILLFLIQLALNLAWSLIFFAIHRIMLAFGLIVAAFLWYPLAMGSFGLSKREIAVCSSNLG